MTDGARGASASESERREGKGEERRGEGAGAARGGGGGGKEEEEEVEEEEEDGSIYLIPECLSQTCPWIHLLSVSTATIPAQENSFCFKSEFSATNTWVPHL